RRGAAAPAPLVAHWPADAVRAPRRRQARAGRGGEAQGGGAEERRRGRGGGQVAAGRGPHLRRQGPQGQGGGQGPARGRGRALGGCDSVGPLQDALHGGRAPRQPAAGRPPRHPPVRGA
ncbi:hypothetical protein EMIHUDRAFT_440841, partial [Emiliania huxleyi CCMP1516]